MIKFLKRVLFKYWFVLRWFELLIFGLIWFAIGFYVAVGMGK